MNLGLLEVQRLLGGEAAVPLPDAEQRVRGDGVGHLRLPTLVLVHCLHTTNLSPHLQNVWSFDIYALIQKIQKR